MSFWGNKYERASKWFELVLIATGTLIALLSFILQFFAGIIIGFVILFTWTFSLGTRYGMRLQELERRYVKSCRQEEEMIIDKRLVIKLTLLSSLPMYLAFVFPALLLPLSFYALAFFIPLFIAAGARFTVIYRRWVALEVKSHYWAMQIGIILIIVALSFLACFLGLYGLI